VARALRNAAGQALRVGTGAVVVGCPECCGPAVPPYYLKACPCQGSELTPCAIPSEPCIWVDGRSVIGGLTGDALISAANAGCDGSGERVIIRSGGICYLLCGQRFYNDGLNGPLSVPDGATIIGGAVVTVERNPDCVDGCAELNTGPEYFECFACSGCECQTNCKWMVCAAAVGQWNVIYNSASTVVLCVNRDVGYTLAQVEADAIAGGYSVDLINNPVPLRVWTGGGSDPRYLPALSCCYSTGRGDCNPTDCLTGQNWTQFGGDVDRWFPLDTCCGTLQGLTYTVSLVFSRVQVQDFGGGDILTTTITAAVDGVVPVGGIGGGAVVNLTVTQRSQRPAQGIDQTSTSPATINLEAICCLMDHPQMPRMNTFTLNSNPVPGEPGSFYSTRTLIDPDPATARRQAWNNSPWGGPFQIAYLDGDPDTTYTSTGNTDGSRGCTRFSFQHTEAVNYGSGGSANVNINLVVSTVRDDAFPCSVAGPCGAGGWGGIEGMMP